MSRGDVLRWTARRLPGVQPIVRQDLIASVDELARRGGRTDRALEIGSLIGFALRSTSRRGALDDRHELIRQGVRVGALVLAIAGALSAWSTTAEPIDAVVAGIASTVAVAIAGGLRTSAMALAAAHVVLDVAASNGPRALSVIVLAAVVAGHRFDARSCSIGAAVTAVAVAAGGLVAAVLPNSTATAALTVATVTVPIALLAIGWFDPRYAVAATVVWLWRFVAVDLHGLRDAADAFGDRLAVRLLLARWLLMGAGVWAAWLVSNAAIKRCLTEFRDR